jgi:MinD superfamily P-loop ATPase
MKIIGVTGGKGGCGKSSVSVNLAYELSKEHKVLLVDSDVDCPNDHLSFNIDRTFFKSVFQRIPIIDENKCVSCKKCVKACVSNALVMIPNSIPMLIKEQCNGCGSCKAVCNFNAISYNQKEIGAIYYNKDFRFHLLSGELKPNEPVSEFVVNELNDIISQVKDEYDYIIIDTAAGTHCPVIAALEICDFVFCVTEPTPLGVHDLEIILKLLKKLNLSSQIIINKSDLGDSSLISKLAKKYDLSVILKIPYNNTKSEEYTDFLKISEITNLIGNFALIKK